MSVSSISQRFSRPWYLLKGRTYLNKSAPFSLASMIVCDFDASVCVCVCERARARACVQSPWRLHLSGSVGLPGNRSTMLC